jgi:signal transduction histidine kinase
MKLNQAFLNLLQNAVEAIDDDGEIQVSVERSESQVDVAVSDNGRGMTPEQISSAFDFNFTKKAGRVRLRLGLATTKRAVEDAGGSLTLESRPGRGTDARVVLPLASS